MCWRFSQKVTPRKLGKFSWTTVSCTTNTAKRHVTVFVTRPLDCLACLNKVVVSVNSSTCRTLRRLNSLLRWRLLLSYTEGWHDVASECFGHVRANTYSRSYWAVEQLHLVQGEASWAIICTCGEFRNAYNSVDWKPEGKMPLGRPRRGWVDNWT